MYMLLLRVESVVALGAGETALPPGRPAIRPSGRPRALLLMGVQVGSPREGGQTFGARKRPLPRVTPDVIPQRHFGERPLAHGAGVLGQRLGGPRSLRRPRRIHGARVKGLVEDELRSGIGRETALPAPPPLATLRLRPLVLLLALVLPRVPGHVLGQGEKRAASRTSGNPGERMHDMRRSIMEAI